MDTSGVNCAMIEDSIALQVCLFVMLLVFFAYKMKGFCCCFLKKFNKYCYIYNIFCTFALDKAY